MRVLQSAVNPIRAAADLPAETQRFSQKHAETFIIVDDPYVDRISGFLFGGGLADSFFIYVLTVFLTTTFRFYHI